jgi:AcrR family transcriptional regulator
MSVTQTLGTRHKEILRVATELVAERGLKAASLRELARRVGVSQPSLYHYFSSKDELVQQIVQAYADEVVVLPAQIPGFSGLKALIRYALNYVLELYLRPSHVVFVRFMFAITLERPELGSVIGERFLRRGMQLVRPVLQPYADSENLRDADRELMVHMALDSVIMHCIEQRVLFSRDVDPQQTTAYVDFIADVVVEGVCARAARRTDGENGVRPE